jgi:hypothetical protein
MISNTNIFLIIIFLIIFYVYYSLVLQTISKKLNYSKPWLAWIPLANLFLYPILAKRSWLYGFVYIIPFAFIPFISYISENLLLIPYLLIILIISYYNVSWTWKIFNRRKYPGWLSLSQLFIFLGFGFILYLVILGIVAWKNKK